MNVIGVVLDCLRQEHVSYYNGGRPVLEGVPAVRTPNLDAFAQQSIVFDSA